MFRQIIPRAAAPRLIFRPAFTTTTTRFLTTPPTPPTPPTPETPPPPPAAQPPQQLTYLVNRSATRNLAVYNHAKRGGNKKLTTIKKIEGDVFALRKDVAAHLKLPDEDVVVNPITLHIVVKGWHKDEISKMLISRGF